MLEIENFYNYSQKDLVWQWYELSDPQEKSDFRCVRRNVSGSLPQHYSVLTPLTSEANSPLQIPVRISPAILVYF